MILVTVRLKWRRLHSDGRIFRFGTSACQIRKLFLLGNNWIIAAYSPPVKNISLLTFANESVWVIPAHDGWAGLPHTAVLRCIDHNTTLDENKSVHLTVNTFHHLDHLGSLNSLNLAKSWVQQLWLCAKWICNEHFFQHNPKLWCLPIYHIIK